MDTRHIGGGAPGGAGTRRPAGAAQGEGGVQCIAITHRLSDLTAAGDNGSEQVQLARGLLADSETRVIHSQRPEEVKVTQALLDLSETEAEVIATLLRGCALWKVGQRSVVVEHRYSGDERPITATDPGPKRQPVV